MKPGRTSGTRKWSASRLLKRLAFSLVLAGAVLVILNGVAWYYMRDTIYSVLVEDDDNLIYRLRPDSSITAQVARLTPNEWVPDAPHYRIRINADGYRGPAIPMAKRPGEMRIVCMGDSITFGLDVEDNQTFASLLRGGLQQRFPGRPVSVINGGVFGYTSRQGLYLFQSRFMDYRPDVVIWGFGWNDESVRFALDLPDSAIVPLAPGAALEGSWLRKQAFLWLFRRPLVQAAKALFSSTVGAIGVAEFMRALDQMQEKPVFRSSPAQYVDSRVPVHDYETNLHVIADLCRLRGSQLVVVTFYGTADPYRLAAQRFCREQKLASLDFASLFQRLAVQGAPLEPRWRELFTPYQDKIKPGNLEKSPILYYTTDHLHPNALGHYVIAGSLLDLLENGPRSGAGINGGGGGG